MMEYHDIIKMFIYFYLIMLINFIILYLKSMYDQYKNAHDKWYEINKDYKKTDKKDTTYDIDNPEYSINQLD